MMTQMVQRLLLCSLLLRNVVVADHLMQPTQELVNMKCDLECHNNGVCRFLTRDPHDLQKMMQSGKMIHECICPMGYSGLSCDHVLLEQDDEEGCATGGDCDCAGADQLSIFAGEQCRKPFTEFCASLSNSVGGHISYCTHGGKCRGDLIAAERSPWNTKNNYLFQHAGCICPPEFQGEHCELLNKEYHPLLHIDQNVPDKKEEAEKSEYIFIIFCSAAVGVLGLVMVRKVRRNRLLRSSLHHDLPRPPLDTALNALYYPDDDDVYRSDSSEEGDREDRDLVKKGGDELHLPRLS